MDDSIYYSSAVITVSGNAKAVVPAVMVEAEGTMQGAALIPSEQG